MPTRPASARPTGLSALRHWAQVALARLRSSDEREHEMAINRVAISVLIGLYLTGMEIWSATEVAGPLATISVYSIISLALFAHIVVHPKRLAWRRIVAMSCDIGALSYGIYVGGEVTAALYPIYLWVILGNGFRFGVASLQIAMGIAVLSFAFVVMESPYWWDNSGVGIGLLIGLIALPLYASKLIRNLSEAKKAAEEASVAKSQFLAAISHEFRTPLHGIIGMSDMLRRSELDDEQRDMAITVRNSANALLALINEVLDFSRIEAGQMPTAEGDFDLHDVLSLVRASVSVQAENKGVRFALHVAAETPQRLCGDARHLTDILTNLAGNAVKFTENGSVTISVDLLEEPDEAGHVRLRFEVTDTGIGIAEDAQAKIFEHFSQADDTIINRFGGTGLGLAIVKRLVELHSGEVGVTSTPGEGSTFWFELPMRRAATETVWVPRLAAGQAIMLTGDADLAAALDGSMTRLGLGLDRTAKPAELVGMLRSAAGRGIRRCLLFLDQRDMGDDPLELADALVGRDPAIAPALVLIRDPKQPLPKRVLQSLIVTVLDRDAPSVQVRRALQMAAASGVRTRDADDSAPLTASRSRAVLIADDNPTNQKVLSKILEKAGHDVEVAENGEAALDALGRNDFDLVLMDVNMPVLNGIEATKLYRFASLGQRMVPIVGLTADATPTARERCLEAGMVECLTKPVEPAELLQKMEEIIAAEEGRTPQATEVEGGNVARISAHPKFRASGRAVVDADTLEDLQQLGGAEFVREVVSGFVNDTQGTLDSLSDLCTRRDLIGFRSQAHALRSGSANVGAQGIFAICSKLEAIEEDEFLKHGSDRLRELQLEVAQVRDVLTGYLDDPRAASND